MSNDWQRLLDGPRISDHERQQQRNCLRAMGMTEDALMRGEHDTVDSLRRLLAAASELLATRELQITALRQALHEVTSLRDATDPEPRLVAERDISGMSEIIGALRTSNEELTAERDSWERCYRSIRSEFNAQAEVGRKAAYYAACHIVDRDIAAGVDDHGIIDNVLAELAGPVAVPYETILATDATDPEPRLVAETHSALYETIMATPRPDPETPRRSDAESAAGLSGEKSDTGRPAGGRAPFPARALRPGDGIPRE